MKILELAPYVFVEGHRYGSRNQSGLAYMIRSICDMLATNNTVHVITQSILTKTTDVNGWVLVRRDLFSIIASFKIRYFFQAIKLHQLDNSISIIRALLYSLSAGQVEQYIKSWEPDLVHIHGISSSTIPFYLAAIKGNMPILTTLHGLVSFHSIVPAPIYQKELERRFLDVCIRKNYSVTVISSGMKHKLRDLYGTECPNISVIPNCFRSPDFSLIAQLRDNGVKNIICVGSLTPLKNQIQVIRVLPFIQNLFKERFKVLLHIVGDGPKLHEWQQYCNTNAIEGVFFHGRKTQTEVFELITNSDLMVFPSIEEGFGIPIIEAYSCGRPVVAFDDIDASCDVANDDCCIFANNRSDEALEEAISLALVKEWNTRAIVDFSRHFSLSSIAKQYEQIVKLPHKVWDRKDYNYLISSTK